MSTSSVSPRPDAPVFREAAIDFDRPVYCILGLPIDAVTLEEAADQLNGAMHNARRCVLSTANANFLMSSYRNPRFRDALLKSDLSTADGMPIVWLAWMIGIPIRERVSGAGLFERLNMRCDRSPVRLFFFGGAKDVATRAAERVNAAQGRLSCVGAISPGFGSAEALSAPEAIRVINDSQADFLVISLGAEKGHEWIDRNLPSLSVPVISHLGAVINFSAGSVRRAPRWMQDFGLEWLWRIKEEPPLWRRYADDGCRLTWLLLSRHLPYMIWMRLNQPTAAELDDASVEIGGDNGITRLTLAGAWNRSNDAALRKSLAEVAALGRPVEIDLSQVSYVDPAVVALLLLLRGHCLRNGFSMEIVNSSRVVTKILRYCCAEFLLGRQRPPIMALYTPDSSVRTAIVRDPGFTE